MAFWDQSQLAYDNDFNQRSVACISSEQPGIDPVAWADANRHRLAAAPGFADAYTSAVVAGVEHPGRDEAVISDLQLLAAVQALLNGSTP